jgi:thioredoxin 1
MFKRHYTTPTDPDILNREDYRNMLADPGRGTLIFKFSAKWCGPCQQILPQIKHWSDQLPNDRVKIIPVDIDQSSDLFAMLRSKRIVNGIPALLAYLPGNTAVFAPDAVNIGNGVDDINQFFMEILAHSG